jgi:hypothetical protein
MGQSRATSGNERRPALAVSVGGVPVDREPTLDLGNEVTEAEQFHLATGARLTAAGLIEPGLHILRERRAFRLAVQASLPGSAMTTSTCICQ